jgi:hypothetical protein
MNVWFRPTKLSPACFFRDPGSGLSLSECGSWRAKVVMHEQKDGGDGRVAVPAGKYAPDFEICPRCAKALGTQCKPQRVREVKPSLFSREELIPIEDMKLPRRSREDEEEDEPVFTTNWEAQVDF